MIQRDNDKTAAVIGAGRVGTAMAQLLPERGYKVVKVCDLREEAAGRAARLAGAVPTADPVEAARDAGVVIIATPDGAIERTCRLITESGVDVTGKKFIHMSGALSLGALDSASRRGADVLSIHPMQTFADLQGALDNLPGSTFGVTCDPGLEAWARDFVEVLDGRLVMVDDGDKVLYHAAAVIACNLLVMVEYGAERLYGDLGLSSEEVTEAFMPLVRGTVDNIARLGSAAALTGPLARGDLETIRAHLDVLERFDPELARLYRDVSLWGLRLVRERGEVPEETVEEMRRLLGDNK